MNLKLLFMTGFVCVFWNTINAQSEDQGEIIKQSIVLKSLQKKLPNAIKENMKDNLILNQGVNFTFNHDLSVGDKSIVLISEQELANKKSNGFFVFDTISIKNSKATVVYSFVYQNDSKKIVVPVRLLLEKEADKWVVINSIIN